MTAEELRIAREAIGISATEMARQLATPLRTYQDWESGENRIPGIVGVAVGLVGRSIDCSMCRVKRGIVDRINADFPQGIISQ